MLYSRSRKRIKLNVEYCIKVKMLNNLFQRLQECSRIDMNEDGFISEAAGV